MRATDFCLSPRKDHHRITQKEIPKLAMMAWIEKAIARKSPASHGRRSRIATMAARIATVASVRG